MIRSTTATVESRDIHDLPMAEFLAAVRWGDNCRPVEPGTEQAVLETHRAAPRPTKLKPNRHDVENLTKPALLVIQMFAQGMGVGAIAQTTNTHEAHVSRFKTWVAARYRVRPRELQRCTDGSIEGIRQFLLADDDRRDALATAVQGPSKLPKIDKGEVMAMTDRVVRILSRVAMGVTDHANAAYEGVRMTSVGHILRILRTKKDYLQSLKDKSTDNIRRLMLVQVGGMC